MDVSKFCGWKRNSTQQWKKHGEQDWVMSYDDAWSVKNYGEYDKKEYILIRYPIKCEHDAGRVWFNERQGIGDCVSHGGRNVVDCIMGIQDEQQGYKWEGRAATEPIYGGCRVEAMGRNRGGRSDGATAIGQQRFLHNYGCVLRHDLTDMFDHPEFDLRKYNARTAKNWGDWGCGGEWDKKNGNKFDDYSRRYPMESAIKATSVEQAAVLIQNGFALSHCSNYGTNMKRDANGVCYRLGSWAHCMAWVGVRFFKGEIQLLNQQSWGASVTGAMPGFDDPLDEWIKKCCWWMPAGDCARIIRGGGTWAFSQYKGLKRQRLNFANSFAGR